MRILMSALQPGGGIRTFFRYVYSQPDFQDCSFILVAPDQGLTEYLGQFIPSDRFKIIEANPSSRGFVGQLRDHIKRESFDLIHSHGFSAGLLTEVARVGTGVPHLMTAHDVFLSSQFQGFKGRLKKAVMGLLFRHMTGIHTVTEDARDNFLSFFPGVKHNRVHGILHGVDTEYFREGQARDLKTEIGLPPDSLLVGFFGRFMNQKGFRLLVDAMKQIVSRSQLSPIPHVVTFGWGGFIREDYDYLKRQGLGDFFHQMEQTHDMATTMKGVDVIVMPSRWEACGLLAMEALAAGKPIIASDCLGLREVIEGTPARAIQTGSSDSLAAAMVNELDNLSTREQDFKEYQEMAVKRFHIRRPAHALRTLYREFVT